MDASWHDHLHFGAESGEVHLVHKNLLVVDFASALLLVEMVEVDGLASGAVFARINHVLHLLVRLLQVCDQLVVDLLGGLVVRSTFVELLYDQGHLHFNCPSQSSDRIDLLLVVIDEDILAHDVEVVGVFAVLGAVLLAVDLLARREHFVAEVAVAILHVRIVVIPHQQQPLLHRVKPYHQHIVKSVQILSRVHNFAIFLINF